MIRIRSNLFFCFILFIVHSGYSQALRASVMPNEEMDKILKEFDKKGGRPLESLSAEEARREPTMTDAVRTVMATSKDANAELLEMAEVKDITIDGAAGLITARLYRPYVKNKKGNTLLPIVLYFHGGGFVVADNDVYDATPRSLANKTRALFLSVEYRKAPEAKFPAAHDDAYAAYKWVIKNASLIGGDPHKVAVAGEGVGANLALNVAIKARDEKFPLPVHELLIYPLAGINTDTTSYRKYGDARPFSKSTLNWFLDNYLTSPAERRDPRINLVEANFKGLAPATVITAQVDPLRSEGEELFKKMKKQGVAVHYRNYDGVTHDFFGMAPVLREARSAQEMASARLRSSLKR